jgi:hypothetical protein
MGRNFGASPGVSADVSKASSRKKNGCKWEGRTGVGIRGGLLGVGDVGGSLGVGDCRALCEGDTTPDPG